MSFYSVLSQYYDEIFPAGEAEMRFVARQLSGKTRLLDVGCGNGNKTVLLAQPKRTILGLDGDAAMVAQACANYGAPGVNYAVADMRELKAELAGQTFDGVLCLGNTLVHLTGKAAIKQFINDIYALLVPEGVFVVQILHYEWIIAGNVSELPFTETPNITFKRSYVWRDGRMYFATRLLDKLSGQEYVNEIELLPLLTAELADMLAASGFGNIRHFGDYSGAPLKHDSLASIIVCAK